MNPAYSLRAFAQFLGIHSSALSAVLKQKRGLPLTQIDLISERLGLSPEEKELFTSSILSRRSSLGKLAARFKARTSSPVLLTQETHYRVIAEWEHYAVFHLLETRGFRSDPSWIAKRLGISVVRADTALRRLEDLKLIERDSDGNYHKSHASLTTTQDISSSALRQSHRDYLERAGQKLEQVPVSERYFGTTTVAIDPEKIDAAKDLIREFRRKLASFLSEGECKEVYEIGIQLFPVTRNEGETK